MRPRVRSVLGLALALWAVPRPALAHSGHCHANESFTTLGIGTFLGLMLFHPWRKSEMNMSAKASRWVLPGLLATVVTLGACGGNSGSSTPRPQTAARLEITQPTPNQNVPPTFTLTLNLMGAKVVDAGNTTGPLRPDEGHIHVTLDGKLISMTYSTSQEMKDIAPGPHNLQAEFVAVDHAPFANRVIVAVAFNVNPASPATASPS